MTSRLHVIFFFIFLHRVGMQEKPIALHSQSMLGNLHQLVAGHGIDSGINNGSQKNKIENCQILLVQAYK